MASSNDVYVTKEYFDLRMDMQEAIFDRKLSDTRAELKDEIASVRTELKDEIASVRTELKSEIAEVRSDMKELRAEINGLVHWNYWVLAFVSIIIVVAPSLKNLVDAFAELLKDLAKNRRLKIQDTEK